MGLPHWAHNGEGSVCVRAARQSWQNGMGLPESRSRVQIRHGAGNTSEASASHIPLEDLYSLFEFLASFGPPLSATS